MHTTFKDLAWGMETRIEDGVCKYCIKTFHDQLFIYRPGVGDGSELVFSLTQSHHPLLAFRRKADYPTDPSGLASQMKQLLKEHKTNPEHLIS